MHTLSVGGRVKVTLFLVVVAVVTVVLFLHGTDASGRSAVIAFVLGSLRLLSLLILAVGLVIERRKRRGEVAG